MRSLKIETVKISDFKAHLAAYLRQVKAGQEIELLDRGSPVARLVSATSESVVSILMPKKEPTGLAKLKSQVKNSFTGEVMDILNQERDRR